MVLPATYKFLFFTLIALVHGQNPPTRQFKSVVVPVTSVPATSGFSRLASTTERIVYYEDQGFAIAHGDINIGLEKDLLARDISRGPPQVRRAKDRRAHMDERSMSIIPTDPYDRRWPNATITYKFNDAEAEQVLESIVNGAIARWKEANPFLQFKKSPTSSEVELGILKIVHVRDSSSCWSPIGHNTNWEMVMVLNTGCQVAGTVHEFGHALGLFHEHQRPDRDNHILFNCSALVDYPTFGGADTSCPGEPSKCCEDSGCWGNACSFVHIPGYYYSEDYDYNSVMHYRADAFAISGGKTLVGLNGSTVPAYESGTPSPSDITRVCEIYTKECQEGPVKLVCGDGVLQKGEECDDGNNIDGDGCSSRCTKENLNPGSCEICLPSPVDNRCDISTSCISTGAVAQPKHFCACRAGYKANLGYSDSIGDIQWRAPFIGQEYRVFVKPGVICNTLCDNWSAGTDSCAEVPIKSECMS